jgi:hypothetical protein
MRLGRVGRLDDNQAGNYRKWMRAEWDSRDGAIKDFSSAWGRLLNEASAECLQRTWEWDRVAHLRWHGKASRHFPCRLAAPRLFQRLLFDFFRFDLPRSIT